MFSLKKAPSLVLAALVAAAIPIIPALQAQAQDSHQSSLSLPQSVAPGTKVWIDGDPSLKPATESLMSSFEEQFPGTNINYENQGSDAAVTGVISGRLDVAAIGRGLTNLEEKAGVETLSLPREKIATFVGVENPFRGEISDQQFVQIFRGEITNWSELGGEDVPIRFIDIAATSDTRRSLGSYDLFQAAPFESGETAIIQPNNISTVIENLGADGIGYALFEQVKDRPEIRILPMHGVMPTDVRYPFSQPRNFAYLGANPTPEAIAFLGYVNDTAPTASEGHDAGPKDWSLGRNSRTLGNRSTVQNSSSPQSTVAGSTLSSVTDAQTASSQTAGSQAASQGNSTSVISYRPGIMDTIHAPWWWLVPLAPLGVIGFAAMRRKRLDEAKAADMGATATSTGLNGAGLAGLGAAGAGLTGVGLAARGLRGRSTAEKWSSNSLNGTVSNDDAAGFALGMTPNQTPHRQTVNELEPTAQAPQGPAMAELTSKQLPSIQPNQPLDQPINKQFEGKTVAQNTTEFEGVKQPATEPLNLTFPNPVQSLESIPGLGTVASAGLAAAGFAGAGLAAAKASDHDAAPPDGAATTDKVELDLKETDELAMDGPGANALNGEIGDRPAAQQAHAPQSNNLRHLSDRRRRELVDHSIDKALERPNGGKKNMPPQDQPLPELELQYDNPKPEATETAANLDPTVPLSPPNSATSRNQGKLSAEENTALGNALKRAGLGAAGIAGAAGLTNHLGAKGLGAKGKTEHNPKPAVAEASEMTPTGPSSRLEAPMAGPGNSDNEQTWITLTPLNSHQGEVNWHISEEHRLEAKRQGGQRMMIRIHDADPTSQTEPWLISSYTYECRNSMDRKQVDLPVADRDYVAEIGFLTAEEDWIHIARSFHSHSPTAEYDGCRIVIMPCDPHRQMRSGPTRHPKPQAYVYWDIAPEFKRRLRKQGGQMLALRIYDADHINLDQQPPHHTDEYMLDENARDKVVTVPTAEHDYVAEIGYLTIDGAFLSLGRSIYAHIPVAVSQQ